MVVPRATASTNRSTYGSTYGSWTNRLRGALVGAFLLFSAGYGCETIVGIHGASPVSDAGLGVSVAGPGSDGGSDDGGGDGSDNGSSPGRRDGGADAGAIGGTPSTDVVADRQPATDASTDLAADRAREEGAANDAAPSADSRAGPTSSSTDAGSSDSGATMPDSSTDAPGDAGPPRVACTPDPSVANPLQGTAYLYASGPNSGVFGGQGACSFPNAQLAKGTLYGAIDTRLDIGASRCGACMRVNNGTTSVDVEIIDTMSPIASGYALGLDPAALAVLSPAGLNIDVRFSFVPCSTVGNIGLVFEGPLDPSVLVMNHRNPLRSIRLSSASATVDLLRRDYNYWAPPSGFLFDGGPVSLTLVDLFGNSVQIPNLTVSTTLQTTNQQFPECAQ